MTDHLDRETKFSDAEFDKLERNADGDVIDISTAFIWFTEWQVLRLTGDDQTRVDDLDEDMRCEIASFRADFEC